MTTWQIFEAQVESICKGCANVSIVALALLAVVLVVWMIRRPGPTTRTTILVQVWVGIFTLLTMAQEIHSGPGFGTFVLFLAAVVPLMLLALEKGPPDD